MYRGPGGEYNTSFFFGISTASGFSVNGSTERRLDAVVAPAQKFMIGRFRALLFIGDRFHELTRCRGGARCGKTRLRQARSAGSTLVIMVRGPAPTVSRHVRDALRRLTNSRIKL